MPGTKSRRVQPLLLDARISITRVQNAPDADRIGVAILDHISGAMVGEARMSLTNFAEALTGRGDVPCVLTVYVGAPWGKRHEYKREYIQIPQRTDIGADWTKKVRQAVEPFQVDGWEARQKDAENWHNVMRWSPGKAGGGLWPNSRCDKPLPGNYPKPAKGHEYYAIGFDRYVDPDMEGDADGQ